MKERNYEVIGRLVKEIRDLKTKLTKLVKFMEKEDFRELDIESQNLLKEQQKYMVDYLRVLEQRFELLNK